MKITTLLTGLAITSTSLTAIANQAEPTYETVVGKSLTQAQIIEMEANWLAGNTYQLGMYGAMPKSYDDTEAGIGEGTGLGYWQYLNTYNQAYQEQQQADPQGTKIERAMLHNGLDIYDGAVWQIALSVAANANPEKKQAYSQLIDNYYKLLDGGQTAEFSNFYANANPNGQAFQYGWDTPITMQGHSAYLFKFISPTWGHNVDPLTSENVQWPEYSAITGEQAWAAFIGPIQSAYVLNDGQHNPNWASASNFLKLAVQSLPAIVAMQSDVGGIYYSVGMPAPDTANTAGKLSISLENNFSIYAGLHMLQQALESQIQTHQTLLAKDDNNTTVKAQLSEEESQLEQVNTILAKLTKFLENGYDNAKPFDTKTGLYYTNLTETAAGSTEWTPNDAKDFAVDVQTWGATTFGKEIDTTFGAGTAYNMWQKTKEIGGYYDNKDHLLGVGYTEQKPGDDHYELSGEWTFGAINMAVVLAAQYTASGDEAKAKSLLADASAMKAGTEQEVSNMDKAAEGKLSYLYANQRTLIPFGWYSNKVPATASTSWALFTQDCFNPLELGGGDDLVCPWKK
mgnify:CR=1 FL=1|tara:strand:+ start:54347 stop:56053 length:1707 start_codon:yes stop_codon:yes gene_type:complete